MNAQPCAEVPPPLPPLPTVRTEAHTRNEGWNMAIV